MTHLVNSLDAVVTEAIDGHVRSSDGELTRLDGHHPDIKVVVRTGWTKERVALVSGGGSGHEPAHAGFVGKGLLTAAVCGEIFASPSVDAVYAAICAVTGDAGCLVITKNYTGDRLAFGLAVERARSAGLNVEMVVVADDVALPDTPQPRGLAGTLFVHKIAGAAAQHGAPLADVVMLARRVAAGVKTIGVSLSAVAIPGRPSEERIAEGQAELGLGIHGEPGVFTVDVEDSAKLVHQMTTLLEDELPAGPLALLVNNLGGIAALELGVVLRDVLETSLGSRAALIVGPAPLMTSLSARGFSLSALPLDPELVDGLRAPSSTHGAWPTIRAVSRPVPQPMPDLHVAAAPASENRQVRQLLQTVARSLIQHESRLNELDARVGDGDTGSTFATAAARLLNTLDELPLDDSSALLTALSTMLATTMGGSSGVLGSIFFAAAGTALATGTPLAVAFEEGANSLQRYGGASPGERTLLDALVPAIDVLRSGGSLSAAADAAEAGAAHTATMVKALAGRSALVPAEHLEHVQDPGAAAVAVMFRAATRS